MSDFIDPLRDSRFPDRPQHPDYWRLSECVTRIDGEAVEGGKTPFEIIEIDEASFMYLAKSRVQRQVDSTGKLDKKGLSLLLLTVYIDAFALGQAFEKAGGHRHDKA